jgi:toxin ParE1/3/4
MKRITRSWQAEEDLKAASAYYARKSVMTARKFVRSVQTALDLLRCHPGIGSSRYAATASKHGLRNIVVKRFPYLIFYFDKPEEIFVFRIMHMGRDIPETLLDMDSGSFA